MLAWGHSWYNQEKLMGFFEKIHGWNLPQTNSGMNGLVIWTGWLASEELGRRTCKKKMCDLHRVTLIYIYMYIYIYIKNWLGTNKWMRWSSDNDPFLPRLFDIWTAIPGLSTPRDDLPGPISGWTLPVQDMPPICHQWTATKLMDCWLLSYVLEKPTWTTHDILVPWWTWK